MKTKSRKFGNFILNGNNNVDFYIGNIALDEEDLYYLELLLKERNKRLDKKSKK